MDNRRNLYKRVLRVLLPMVILAGIIIGSCQIKRTHIKANNNVVYVKAKVTQIIEDNSGGQPFGGAQKVSAKITGGQYKGQNCELDNSNSFQRGAFCTTGTKVIAVVKDIDGVITGSVYNYDRTMMVYVLLGLFSLCLVLVGGKKGAAALYALIFTFICVICMYVPLLYIGLNGIFAALLTSVVILAASIYILNGVSSKTVCAIIGTTVGIVLSGGLAMIAGSLSNLNGYNMSDAESMIYIANSSKLHVSDILYAGILISSLGAVMDVSVSIVAAITEIHEKAPDLKAKELFMSGMHVGHDMMGTMSNTLILAFAGGSINTLVFIYAYNYEYLQMINMFDIGIEIIQGVASSMGVILTVPICSLLAACVQGKFLFTKETLDK